MNALRQAQGERLGLTQKLKYYIFPAQEEIAILPNDWTKRGDV
jgi:hypothetical protein